MSASAQLGGVAVSGNGCPDCPATRQGVFAELVGNGAPCTLHGYVLEAREAIPPHWFGAYAFGLVRRGIIVRQRVDPEGRATAIDAAGPGCIIPLDRASHGPSAPAAYAATRAIVCLSPPSALEDIPTDRERAVRDLSHMQSAMIERMERITDARARSTVEGRVAALLCALADTLSGTRRRESLPSDLQQRDLAALLGIRHETVCRVLRRLQQANIVARDDDGLHIVDRPALESS